MLALLALGFLLLMLSSPSILRKTKTKETDYDKMDKKE